MSSRPYPMIPDLPASVSVQNQKATVLSINGLPDIAGSATVVISLAAMSEARRRRRWLAIVGAVSTGDLAFTSPNPLWGTLRIQNLTAALQVLGYGEPPFSANETRDVDMVVRPLSQRFRLWNDVRSVGDGSLFAYVATPSTEDPHVTAILPVTGSIGGGTPVSISGEGFAPGCTVTIGGVSATSVVWVNDSLVTCIAPAGTVGAKNVVVTNSGGHLGTLTNGYTYALVAPTVTSLTPNTGDLAGVAITITGVNFEAAATVTVGGTPCTSVVRVNSTTITCVVPVGTAGAKNVVVTNSVGKTGTKTGGFTYTAATFGSISPATGPAAGGTSVTILGTNFKSGATVAFGVAAATSVVVTATSITCVTPAVTAGAVDVVVTNPGTGGSVATGTAAFTYA